MKRILILVLSLMSLVSLALGAQGTDFADRAFQSSAYEYSFRDADRAVDPTAWWDEAREGLGRFMQAWETRILAMDLDPEAVEEGRRRLEDLTEADLEARFQRWLQDRFLGQGARALRDQLLEEIRTANETYLYQTDEEGRVRYDATGKPLLIRPDQGRDLEADRQAWRSAGEARIHQVLQGWNRGLAFLDPGAGGDETSWAQAGAWLEAQVSQELFRILDREEQSFVTRRSADVWSLRRQSDQEAAAALSQELIGATQKELAAGIQKLETRIEAAKAGTGNLALEGKEWLVAFEAQFTAGMRRWEEAEKQFMVRRLQWEQDSDKLWDEGVNAWANAFEELAKEQEAWEAKAQDLYRKGEAVFQAASEQLEQEIAQGRALFAQETAQRSRSGADRARAWVDVYAQAVQNTRLSLDMGQFWMAQVGYQAETLEVESALAWITQQQGLTSNSEQRKYQLGQFRQALEAHKKHAAMANEARDTLAEEYALALGRDKDESVLVPGTESADYHLDEYQIELLKAQAVENWWKRKVDIARDVLAYATDVSAGRVTEAEGLAALAAAKTAYESALAAYGLSTTNLETLGTALGEAQGGLEAAKRDLEEKNAALDRVSREYALLLASIRVNNPDFIKDEALALWQEIHASPGVLNPDSAEAEESSEAKALVRFMEARRAYGQGEEAVQAARALQGLVEGNGSGDSLKDLEADARRVEDYTGGQPVSGARYGLQEGDATYTAVADLVDILAALDYEEDDPSALEAALAGLLAYEDQSRQGAYEARRMAVELLGAQDAEAWYRSVGGQGTDQLALGERLWQEWDQSRLTALRSRIDAELIALAWRQDTEAEATAATKALGTWYTGTDETLEASLASLQTLKTRLSSLGADAGYSQVQALIKDINDPAIHAFVQGMGFFALGGLDMGSVMTREAQGRVSQAEARLSAWNQYSQLSRAGAQERLSRTYEALAKADEALGLDEADFGNLTLAAEAIKAKGSDWKAAWQTWRKEWQNAMATSPAWLAGEIQGGLEALEAWFASQVALGSLSLDTAEARQTARTETEAALRTLDEQVADSSQAASINWETVQADYGRHQARLDLLASQDRMEVLANRWKADAQLATTEGRIHGRQTTMAGTEVQGLGSWLRSVEQEQEEALGRAGWRLEKAQQIAAGPETTEGAGAALWTSFEALSQGFLASPDRTWKPEDEILLSASLGSDLQSATQGVQALEGGRAARWERMAVLGTAWLVASDSNALKARTEEVQARLQAADTAMVAARSAFATQAELFATKAQVYQDAYLSSKTSYALLDQAQKALETQEAIQRWASTAYLGEDEDPESTIHYRGPAQELARAQEQARRAGIALQALRDLYAQEGDRTYSHGAYEALYTTYRERYRELLAVARARVLVAAEYQKERVVNETLQQALMEQRNKLAGSGVNSAVGKILKVVDGYLTLDYTAGFGAGAGMSAQSLAQWQQSTVDDPDHAQARTALEASVDTVHQWLAAKGFTEARARNWGLARDYLLRKLAENDVEIGPASISSVNLNSGNSGGQRLWAPVPIPLKTLAEYNNGYSGSGGGLQIAQEAAWNSLTGEEREMFERYLALDLGGALKQNSVGYGALNQWSARLQSQHVQDVIEGNKTAQNAMAIFNFANAMMYIWNPFTAWISVGYMAAYTYNVLQIDGLEKLAEAVKDNTQHDYRRAQMAQDINRIDGGADALAGILSDYAASSQRLAALSGQVEEGVDAREVFRASLAQAGMEDSEIDFLLELRGRAEGSGVNLGTSTTESLVNLAVHGRNLRDDAEARWQARYQSDRTAQAQAEAAYHRVYEEYLAGRADEATLKAAQGAAYGPESASARAHLGRQGDALIDLALGGDAVQSSESHEAQTDLASVVALAWQQRYAAEARAREAEWDIARRDLTAQANTWREAAGLIFERGRADFARGRERMQEAQLAWAKEFKEQYDDRSLVWQTKHLAMLDDRLAWVNQATAAADQAVSFAVLSQLGKDAESMAQRHEAETVLPMVSKAEAQETLDQVLGQAGIRNLDQAFAGILGSGKPRTLALRKGLGGSAGGTTGSILVAATTYAQESAEEMSGMQARVMAANARLAAEAAVKGLQDQVTYQNEAMDEQMNQTFVVQGSWQRQGDNYVKDVLEHSTAFDPYITDRKSVKSFQDYILQSWDLGVDLSDGNLADMDAAGVRAMIGLAQRAVGQKQEEVFGAPEDFEDEAVAKRRIEVKFYETRRRKIGEEVSYYTDSDGVRQTQTTPIYENYTVELTDEMKPQTWGPGDFGDHVGYAPVLKLSPNVDDGRRAIFEAQGKGEMGRLMGDFYYYMLIESKGWSVANQPMYEKGIWDDRNTWLKAPTIRGVVDIGLNVAVGIATAGAGNAALGLIDDAVFGALDVASGHKTWQQAGLAFGQKALTAAASAGISGAFDGAQSVASGFQGVFENSLIGVTQGITNAFASSTINAFQINPDGSLGFSGDAFVGGLQSGLIGAATGMASSLTTGGLNLALGGTERGFWEGAVNLAGSVASKGTSLGIHALMAGPGASFGDVWDASGGLSINVLDLGTLAGFMMGGVFKGALDTDAMNTRATVMGALSGTGLNINIGSKGITGSLGQGSDIGLMANVASLAQGLQTRAWALEEAQRQSLASGVSATSFYEGIGYAYSFGNAVGRGTLERLRTGYDELDFSADTAGGKAYTTADASGRRRIAMSSLDSGASFAVELAHEANRDGYQSADQRRETRNAVRDHTTMALALGRELGDSVFAGRQDIMRDMYAYMQTGGGAGFDQYADENYDSSADYWLVKMDGTIVDDGTNYFSREVYDANGNLISKKIDGTDFTGSRTLALVNALGTDAVEKMFVGNEKAISTYDNQTLKEVLGWSDEAIKLARKEGFTISPDSVGGMDNYKKLLGEAMLKNGGASFDNTRGKWAGGGVTIPGLKQNESLGVAYNNGTYEFFTAGMTMTRDANGFNAWKNGVASDDYEVLSNTTVNFWKRNLLTGDEENYDPGVPWTSVDKVSNSGKAETLEAKRLESKTALTSFLPTEWYQGNTIVSEQFKMHLLPGGSTYGVTTIGVFTNARTLAGDIIGNDGKRIGHPNDTRWLFHPFGIGGGSDGCSGPLSVQGLDVGEWKDPDVPGSGAARHMEIINKLMSDWGVYNGYDFSVQLLGQRRP